MVDTFVTLIRESDYKTFWRLMGNNIPDTYNEWSYLALKRKNDAVSRQETVHEIEIYPDEFARYAATHGAEYTLQALFNFTFEKGSREK